MPHIRYEDSEEHSAAKPVIFADIPIDVGSGSASLTRGIVPNRWHVSVVGAGEIIGNIAKTLGAAFNHNSLRVTGLAAGSWNDVFVSQDSERFSRLYQVLDEICQLPENWDSYGAEPPGQIARNNAMEVLNMLAAFKGSFNIVPDRVMPSVEGGIAIVFLKDDRYADVECFNDDEIFIGMSGNTNPPQIKQTTLSQLSSELGNISAFLS